MKRTVVVATDVAARGLDIPSVASVVHYDTARTVDGFVHRAGRTAVGANIWVSSVFVVVVVVVVLWTVMISMCSRTRVSELHYVDISLLLAV